MAGMNKVSMPPAARPLLQQLIDLLQEAHFTARSLEVYAPVDRENRLVDRIHAARILAEHLRSAA